MLKTFSYFYDLSTDDTNIVSLDLSDFNIASKSREVTVKYDALSEEAGLLVQVQPHRRAIRVSSPIRCSSRAKINKVSEIKRYEIQTSTDGASEHIRTAVYDITDNPCYKEVSKVLIDVDPDMLIEGESKTIKKIPNAKADVYLIGGLVLDVDDRLIWPTQVNSSLTQSLAPSVKDGLLVSDFVGQPQYFKSPVSIAWSLLAAICEQDEMLCISILKALTNLDLEGGLPSRFNSNPEAFLQEGQNPNYKYKVQFISGTTIINLDAYAYTKANASIGLAFSGPITNISKPVNNLGVYEVDITDDGGTRTNTFTLGALTEEPYFYGIIRDYEISGAVVVPTTEPAITEYKLAYPDSIDLVFDYSMITVPPNAYTTTEIWANSFLGMAMCRAINFLQDRLQLASVKLTGAYEEFRTLLLTKLKGLANFCAFSMNPITNWCCYKFVVGESYDYEQPSLRASAYTNVFLSQYLDLDYDYFLHELASRMFLRLTSAPRDLSSGFYGSFIDREYDNAWAPTYVTVAPTETALYDRCWSCLAMHLWATHFSITPVDYIDQFDNARLFVNPLNRDFDLFKFFLVSSVSSVTFNQIDIPYGSYFSTMAQEYLTLHEFDIFASTFFNLKAREAKAQSTFELQEFRRLMPFGDYWPTEEVNNNISSNIGSMLYAENQQMFAYALISKLIEDAVMPNDNARGALATEWFNLLFYKSGIISGTFATNWVTTLLTRQGESTQGLLANLLSLLGISATIGFTMVNPFSVYTNFETDGSLAASYTADTSILDYNQITELQYISIAYKIVPVFIPNEPLLFRRELRRVPGFPRKVTSLYAASVPNRVTADQYLAAPASNLQVIDGDMLIEPLANYLPRLTLITNSEPLDYLSLILRETLTSGVDVRVVTKRDFNG